MNKKGFTLVELLAVIVLVGIISLIAVPNVSKMITDSKNKAHDYQIDLVKKQAERWSVANIELIDEDTPYYVNVSTLIEQGYIEQDELIDPKSSTVLNGCVEIKYTELYKQYEFTYKEVCPGA